MSKQNNMRSINWRQRGWRSVGWKNSDVTVEAPADSILHYDADIDAFSEQTGGVHSFQHSVLSPQYQLNADGSYTDVGAKPAVDVFDGERWLRSCGAVTNLFPSGWPFSHANIAVSTLNDYVKLEKTNVAKSINVSRAGLPEGALYTATITLRAGSGLTGTKFDFGYYYNGFKPIAVSSFSGPGTYVVTGDPLVRISNLSPTEDTTVSFTLTSILETYVGVFIYPCGAASGELGASVLIKDFMLTDTSYPVPYVPPGVTQPASNATTTNGMWFSLPDGSELWHALAGGPETDGVELGTNGGFDTDIAGWESGTLNGVLEWVAGEARNTRLISNTVDASLLLRSVNKPLGYMYRVSFDAYSPTYKGTLRVDNTDAVGGIASSGAVYVDAAVTSTKKRFTAILKSDGTPKLRIVGGVVPVTVGDVIYLDNISIQRIQPQPLTLATRVRMGVGSGDLANSSVLNVLTPDDVALRLLTIQKDGSGNLAAVLSDGTNSANVPLAAWARGDVLEFFPQVLTGATQMRIGYKAFAATSITWGTAATYAGTFGPDATLKRLMIGYNAAQPQGINKLTIVPGQIADAEILGWWK